MTAQPDLHTDADEWRGEWINFYQYRAGQRHFGQTICASRHAADEVRVAWFKQAADQVKNGLVLVYLMATKHPFWVWEEYDQFPEDSPYIVKARNCTFSIAVPYVPPDIPEDDGIPF